MIIVDCQEKEERNFYAANVNVQSDVGRIMKDIRILLTETEGMKQFDRVVFESIVEKVSVQMRYEDENIWLTQKMMATLYDVSVAAINQHIRKVYEDDELTQEATIKKFLIVQKEGERQIQREVIHYSLQMIIAVGFKVNNQRAVRFRVWANQIVQQYTIKGWVIDAERHKNGGTLTEKYFDEQLEKIQEIRLSKRKFYQKITDIYATAVDYDKSAKTTKEFFAKVQNKMHYAVHGHAETEFEKYRVIQDRLFMSDFDKFMLEIEK